MMWYSSFPTGSFYSFYVLYYAYYFFVEVLIKFLEYLYNHCFELLSGRLLASILFGFSFWGFLVFFRLGHVVSPHLAASLCVFCVLGLLHLPV